MAGGAPKAARYRRKGTPADPRSLTATRSYMVDGLSPARQPASGLAATLLAMVWERPWTGFFLFAAAHAAIAYRTFDSDFAYYCLAQISVLAAFAAVWALMLRIATPAAALAALLIIDGLHYFNFTAPKFNHDVIQLPFWALAGLSFHGALRTGRLGHWAVLGAALGLAFWAKYFVVVLGLPLLLFMLIDPRARLHLATPGPYLAAAISLVIISPHLIWLYQNDWLPLGYAAARAKATNGLLDHLTHPGLFALAQLFWLLPAIIIALPLLRRPHERDATAADDDDRRILALLAFGPAMTVLAESAFSWRALIAMWGS